MTDRPFDRAAEHFLELRKLPVARRNERLVELRSVEPELVPLIERLLLGDDEPFPFAELADDLRGIWEVERHDTPEPDAPAQGGEAPAERVAGGRPRRRPAASERNAIGPYRLLQKIGEGGFGTVYMAEQESPVRRRVALKILKAGMDTKQVIARFEAERQALALMDHPAITRVFDAGETAAGRPYFAMELVNGVPITTYCRTQKLSLTDRLGLFIKVCQGVHHAHQKGIIHRDLKPSNVLVTVHDGIAVPKIIDFGLAKALHVRLTEKTLFTEHRQFMGTPEYMSPEQAEMSGLDVDTRADVYALGVLLYELLTGTTPLDGAELRKVGIAEMQRIIREEDPATPSRRIRDRSRSEIEGSRSDEATAIPAGEAMRRPPGDLQDLVKRLAGDLDWIVMRCIEKDRTRRYETAHALMLDLRAHLEDNPVSARPPSATYRLGKALRRHRGYVLAASAITLTLIGATVVSSIGFMRARHERDRAQLSETHERELRMEAADARDRESDARRAAETASAEASREMSRAMGFSGFVRDVLESPDSEGLIRPDLPFRDVLQAAARRLDAGAMKGQEDVEAEIRGSLARSFFAIAEFRQAERHARRSLELLEALGHAPPQDVAQAHDTLAGISLRLGEREEAAVHYREAIAIERTLGPTGELILARSLGNLASISRLGEKESEARSLFEQALDIRRRVLGAESPETIRMVLNLATLDLAEDRLPEARAAIEPAIEAARRGKDLDIELNGLQLLAEIDRREGHRVDAIDVLEEVLELVEKTRGKDHTETATVHSNLGRILLEQGRLGDAESHLEEALSIRRRALGNRHRDTGVVLVTLAELRLESGRIDLGTNDLREAASILAETSSPEDPARRLADRLTRDLAAGKFSTAR